MHEQPARCGCLNTSLCFLIPGVDGGLSAEPPVHGRLLHAERGFAQGRGLEQPPSPPAQMCDMKGTKRPQESCPSPAQGTPRSGWGPTVVPAVPRPPFASRPSSSRQGAKAGRGRGPCSNPPRTTAAPAPASPPPSWGIKPPAGCRGQSGAGVALGGGFVGVPTTAVPGDGATDASCLPAAPMAGKTHPRQVKPTHGNTPLYPAARSRRVFGVRWVTQPHKRVGLQWGGG